jgi:hypothetical protein
VTGFARACHWRYSPVIRIVRVLVTARHRSHKSQWLGCGCAMSRLVVELSGAQVIEILAEKHSNRRLCRCCNIRQDSIGKTDFVLVNVSNACHGSKRNRQRAFHWGTS